MDNQDKKRQSIIDAAIKRFAHFGLVYETFDKIIKRLSKDKRPEDISGRMVAPISRNILNMSLN